MNDFSELEDQLRKLRPLQPSADLAARIEHALAQTASTSTAGVLPRERRLHLNWLSLGLGLAAAAALMLFARINLDRPTRKNLTLTSVTPEPLLPLTKASAEFVPAGFTRVVYRTRDEGLHFPESSGQPMRRLRSHTRETLQWRNPTTGASLRVSYPSEEIELIPIFGQ